MKYAAVGWTLFLFLLCLMPGSELPDVELPFIDKWVHFILFAAFSMVWLMAYPSLRKRALLLIFTMSVTTGWLVEVFQGMLPMLGRFQDNMDILADGVGGLIGVILFRFFYAAHLRGLRAAMR